MKKLLFFSFLITLLPFGLKAQLARLMSDYHEQNCVTVTQLDKSLYALYQKDNLPPEAEEMLQKLDEVNLLNLNLNQCTPEMTEKVISQFRKVLDNPGQYKLVKSHKDAYGKQLIYTHSKNGKTTDLVVWDQNPQRLDIIELRGDIQLDRIAMLSKALNIKGLNSLTALSSHQEAFETYKQSYDYNMPDMQALAEHMRQMSERMRKHFGAGMNGMMDGFRNMPQDSPDSSGFFSPGDFFGGFSDMDFMDGFMNMEGMTPEEIEEMFKNGENQQRMERIFRSFGDGENVMSNSVQITEENGKTKIKIDSKNSDMTYIIDGQEAPKDNLQMPESILNVNIIPSKEDMKKSYLFITSKDKSGEFISYQGGVLTFKYNNQEYKYNLDKTDEPLLVIDGRLSDRFDTDPANILQIRPISQIEKEVGYYPNAEVIINTRYDR